MKGNLNILTFIKLAISFAFVTLMFLIINEIVHYKSYSIIQYGHIIPIALTIYVIATTIQAYFKGTISIIDKIAAPISLAIVILWSIDALG